MWGRGCRAWWTLPADVLPEPFGQHVLFHRAGGDGEDEIDDATVVGVQPVARATEQQFDQVEPGSLVAVDETVIGHDAVAERRVLFVDPAVVPVVGAGQRRPDGVLVQDARAAAVREGFIVLVESVEPGDAVMPSDLPARAWPRDGRPRFPS